MKNDYCDYCGKEYDGLPNRIITMGGFRYICDECHNKEGTEKIEKEKERTIEGIVTIIKPKSVTGNIFEIDMLFSTDKYEERNIIDLAQEIDKIPYGTKIKILFKVSDDEKNKNGSN